MLGKTKREYLESLPKSEMYRNYAAAKKRMLEDIENDIPIDIITAALKEAIYEYLNKK